MTVKVTGRKHFICPVCKNGSGRKHNDSWVRDEESGAILNRADGRDIETNIVGGDFGDLIAYRKSLDGAEVCGSCVESLRDYGSRVLVYAPGADIEHPVYRAYVDAGLVYIEEGSECDEAETYNAWACAVGRATKYHRTDGWRGYHDSAACISVTGLGRLVRLDDKNLLSMLNDAEVKDEHEALLKRANALGITVVMVVHLTSNVFSTIVQHYVTEEDGAKIEALVEAETKAAEAKAELEQATSELCETEVAA